MKNPNGYGCVRKLSGKRRKPFAVLVTEGWDENERQIRKYIGYYATRSEAMKALAEYNKDPLAFTADKTFAEIYDGWHKDKFFGDYSLEQEHNYDVAYKNCKKYHNAQFTAVRLSQLQSLCDDLSSYEQAYRVKTLVNQMTEWAIAHDLATKNYAPSIKIKQTRNSKPRDRFSDAEIRDIFSDDTRIGKILQVFLYTGLRRCELLNLKREDCHLDEHYLYIRKSKTNNGIRIVPIHNRIYDVVKTFYDEGNAYVFSSARGLHYCESNWDNQFNVYKKSHSLNHTTHETRHTFISMAVTAGLNQTMIKKIVGHTTEESLTERVYTHITIEELRKEINKIP